MDVSARVFWAHFSLGIFRADISASGRFGTVDISARGFFGTGRFGTGFFGAHFSWGFFFFDVDISELDGIFGKFV